MTESKPAEAQFFLVIPPGLEDLALKELNLKLSLFFKFQKLEEYSAKKTYGGILFSGSFLLGCSLNYILRIPTRVTLKIATFKTTDFSDLFKKAKRQEWTKYLRQGPVDIKVATHDSRLKIKSRIEECIQDALKETQKKQAFRKSFLKTPQTVLVRIDEDQVEIAVDTSGEPLYKRGWSKWVGEAPIRETLASALYFQMVNESEASDQVLDPMCGSGTLLFEALDFYRVNRKREFSFQNFPSFPGIELKTWPEDLKSSSLQAQGFELAADTLEVANRNAQIRKNEQVSFSLGDLKELVTHPFATETDVISNPPYDQRIAADLNKISKDFETLFTNPRVKKMALVWPKSHWENRPLQKIKNKTVHTQNGGIDVALIAYFK